MNSEGKVPGKDIRRRRRIPISGLVRLAWVDGQGNAKYAQGNCLDVSESGLRVEVPASIPVGTNLSLSAERIKLKGSATVKHLVRRGSKFVVGLELSQILGEPQILGELKTLALLKTKATVV